MEDWFQLLKDELKEYTDKDLKNWPDEWWKQLKHEGMTPIQAIRTTLRTMGRKDARQ